MIKQIPSPIPVLPDRERTGHKGTYGTVALLGGSAAMSGAVKLAGGAALGAGAGLVRLLVPSVIHSTAASFRPEYTVFPLSADKKGCLSLSSLFRIESLLAGVSAVGVGPGLGRSLGLDLIVSRLFFSLSLPAVFDADALNALANQNIFINGASHARLVKRTQPVSLPAPRILTPHPGEFFRMFQQRIGGGQNERVEAAVQFVQNFQRICSSDPASLVLVLKGANTVVTDGNRIFVNDTGNPGMGTGGSGDVLTGVIAALVAQGLPCYEAAVLGVHIHGIAGDLAAETKGETSLTAADLLDFLPPAFQEAKGVEP